MKLFKEVSYTIDEKIVGKNGSPFTIEIQSKEFHDYKLQNNKDIFLNLNNFKTGNDFANMPDNLEGKLLRRKKIIDIMDYSPNFLGLHIIVSEKVKQIVEELQIESKEYYFRKIRIKNTNDDCYLLLVPFMDYDELLFEKSIYRKVTYDAVSTKTYSCNDERLKDDDKYNYSLHKGYIAEKFIEYDIINLRAGGLYFSERLIKKTYQK